MSTCHNIDLSKNLPAFAAVSLVDNLFKISKSVSQEPVKKMSVHSLCNSVGPFSHQSFLRCVRQGWFWEIFPVGFDKYSGADLTNPWGGTLCGGEVWRLPLSWSRSRPIWLLDNPAFLSDHKMIVMRMTAMLTEFKTKDWDAQLPVRSLTDALSGK